MEVGYSKVLRMQRRHRQLNLLDSYQAVKSDNMNLLKPQRSLEKMQENARQKAFVSTLLWLNGWPKTNVVHW